MTLGTGFLILLSYPPVPGALLRPLQEKYPPLHKLNTMPAIPKSIKWIVVLDGDTELSLPRVIEGVHIYRQVANAKLLMSGGSVFGAEPGAMASARVALNMGVDPKDLVLESESRDTEEEVRQIKDIVGQDKFILVTSASHMPRSMFLFQKAGLDPIPAPAGLLLPSQSQYSPRDFFPSAECVRAAEIAVYEYLGLIWSWGKGILSRILSDGHKK